MRTSDYYPSGVTGNEPEIAGADERAMEVTCGTAAAMVRVPASMFDVLVLMASDHERTTENTLRAMVAEIERHVSDCGLGAGCDFSGLVDAEVCGDALRWTCPDCLTEHEEYR